MPIYLAIGDHIQNASLSSEVTIAVPTGAPNADAVIVQALAQNIRIKLSGTATAAAGFQLRAGDPPQLVPLVGNAFSVIEEAATATLEYQWVRVED